jgi:hypothetical protein
MSFLGRLFRGSKAEQRGFDQRPIDDIPSLGAFYGPGAAHQPGHEVLLRENLGFAAAATRAIANRIASLEIEIITTRRDETGTVVEEVLDDHPMGDLLVKRPHPNLPSSIFMWLTTQWIISTGEAYWLKVRNQFPNAEGRRGLLDSFQPYNPALVQPQVVGGVVQGYRITDGNGVPRDWAADEVVRIYWPDPENFWRSEGYMGSSGIIVDAHKFAMEHIRHHYQHDATPKVVLQSDLEARLPEEAQRKRFNEDWIRAYHGRKSGEQSGVPRMLPPGWSANSLDEGASKATREYLEMLRDDVLMNMGGVPRNVLGQVVAGDRSTAEAQQWGFDMYAISPITGLISDYVNLQVAPEFEGDVAMRFKPFIAPDKQFDLMREKQDLEHGVRSINRVLEDRQDDPVEWGDEPTILSTVHKYDPEAAEVLTNQLTGTPPPPDEEEEEEDPERMARDLHAKVRKLERAAKRKRKAS